MDPLRALLLGLAAALAGCSDPAEAPAAERPRLEIPPPPRIPAFPPPDLAPGTPAVIISLTGTLDAERLAAAGGRLVLHVNDSLVEVQAESGDTIRTLLEKAARSFMADGWRLHLEDGEAPRLFLHMRPGLINLSVQTSSQVPGIGVSWGIG